MFRKILVPLDGSDFGERVLPIALGLASGANAALELVRVAEPAASAPKRDPSGLTVDDPRERGRREAEGYLEDVTGRIRAGADESSPETTVVPGGNVARSLARRAMETGADLVVMATHGHGGLKRAWLGSTADALLRLAPCPILLVRPGADRDGADGDRIDGASVPPFRHIVVPLDGSASGEEVLPRATALFVGGPGRISLIRIVTEIPATAPAYARAAADAEREAKRAREPARDYLEKVAARLESQSSVEADTRVEPAAQPGGAILDFAREVKADAIALSSRGRGGVARLLLGSVADKVIRGSSVPVLVYRAPEDDAS